MSAQRFVAKWRELEKELRVEALGSGKYRVFLDGQKHEVDACRFETGNSSVIIDGQSYDVELEVAGQTESEGKYNSLIRGNVISLTVLDERRLRMALTSKKLRAEGPPVVVSPMPGKVVKLLVQEGQKIEEDQPVVIIEAMKMENELRAPQAARIKQILVKEGQAVEAHTQLILLESV